MNVGIVCSPCRAAGVQVDKAYTRRMIGEGSSFKDKEREQVLWMECRKDTAKGSLVKHRQTQHGVVNGGLRLECKLAAWGDNPRTYGMEFPAKAVPRP